MLTPKDFSPKQKDALRLVLKQGRKRIIFTPDCGFGKTIVGLTIANQIAKSGSTVFIVCEASAVDKVWGKQYLEWSHTQGMDICILKGNPKQRQKLLEDNHKVYVFSYNILEWMVKNYKGELPKCIVADEVSCLKGSSSKYRSHLLKLSKNASVRIGLTATPMTNKEADYWGICRWLDDGKALGKTNNIFRALYMINYQVQGRVLWKMASEEAKQKVREASKHLFVEYELEDSAKIPIVTKRVYAKLKPESQEIYDQAEQDGLLSYLATTSDVGPMKPLDAMHITNRLAVLTSGFLYVPTIQRIGIQELKSASSMLSLLRNNTGRKAVDLFDDRKILMQKVLKAVHKKHKQVPICITYVYRYELEQLQELLPTGVSDKEKDFEERWNKGKIPYLFLQYTRSAKGLNLQQGGNVMIAYSQTFKFEDTYQIVRRLARQGQPKDRVYLYVLHFRNTIDDLKTKRFDERFKGHKAMQRMIMRKNY